MENEKFCLRWNDFESNISVAFQELRDDKDLFDVTLACDDEQIQSHKMILSACSPFFRNILRRNPHTHPLIYMKGVKYNDLQSVLNFMYHGEVNVAQEDLNSFLAVAEDLRVKGLTQNQMEKPKDNFLKHSTLHPKQTPPKRPQHKGLKTPSVLSSNQFSSLSKDLADDICEVVPVKTEPREPPSTTATALQPSQDTTAGSYSVAPVEDDSYGYQDSQPAEYDHYEHYEDAQEYRAGVAAGAGADDGAGAHMTNYAGTEEGQTFQDPSELFQFVQKDPETKKYYCTLCEKFSHQGRNMARNHVESRHFPNTFSYPCDLCGDVLQSRSSHLQHRSSKHLNRKNF